MVVWCMCIRWPMLGQGTVLGWGENFYHTTNHGTNSAEKTMSILYALESAVVVAGPPAVELVIYRLRLCCAWIEK